MTATTSGRPRGTSDADDRVEPAVMPSERAAASTPSS